MADYPTSSCGITGVDYDNKFLQDVEGSAAKLGGCLKLAFTHQVWNLWKTDAGTMPILREYIEKRKQSFGCSNLKLSKKFVRSNVIDWAFEPHVKDLMLSANPPAISDAHVSEDTIYGYSCLWYMRRLVLGKPSFFPNTTVEPGEWVLDRYDLVHAWKILAFFWKQVTGKKVPKKAQQEKRCEAPIYHDPAAPGPASLPLDEEDTTLKPIVNFTTATLSMVEELEIWDAQDNADVDVQTMLAAHQALNQSYLNSLTRTVQEAGRLVRHPLDPEDCERLYAYMMARDKFEREGIVAEGPLPDHTRETTRTISRLSTRADALELSLLEAGETGDPPGPTTTSGIAVGSCS